MHPKLVKSPKHRTRNHVIIYESADDVLEPYSVCEADVLGNDGDWYRQLGIRWDGNRANDSDKGFPSTNGQAVWFWLPHNLEQMIRTGLNRMEEDDQSTK